MKSFNIPIGLSLILTSLIFMNFQCTECEERINGEIDYDIEIQPLLPTYKVGDTIVISSEFNSIFEFNDNNNTFDNSNLSIGIPFQLFQGHLHNNEMFPAIDKFELIQMNGNLTFTVHSDYQVNLFNTCDDTTCQLSMALSPMQAGYYGIALTSGLNSPNDCTFINVIPDEILTNQNNNIEIFEEIGITSVEIDGIRYDDPERAIRQLYFFRVDQ